MTKQKTKNQEKKENDNTKKKQNQENQTKTTKTKDKRKQEKKTKNTTKTANQVNQTNTPTSHQITPMQVFSGDARRCFDVFSDAPHLTSLQVRTQANNANNQHVVCITITTTYGTLPLST